jgi:hypothetical protein
MDKFNHISHGSFYPLHHTAHEKTSPPKPQPIVVLLPPEVAFCRDKKKDNLKETFKNILSCAV